MHELSRYLRIIWRRFFHAIRTKRRILFGQKEREKERQRNTQYNDCAYNAKEVSVCMYGVSPRPLQIVCAHACHISLEDARNHAIRMQHLDPLALARSLARCKCNLPPPRRVHLSVIRMPIARLKNDYGHERRFVAVRHNAILSLSLVLAAENPSETDLHLYLCTYNTII